MPVTALSRPRPTAGYAGHTRADGALWGPPRRRRPSARARGPARSPVPGARAGPAGSWRAVTGGPPVAP